MLAYGSGPVSSNPPTYQRTFDALYLSAPESSGTIEAHISSKRYLTHTQTVARPAPSHLRAVLRTPWAYVDRTRIDVSCRSAQRGGCVSGTGTFALGHRHLSLRPHTLLGPRAAGSSHRAVARGRHAEGAPPLTGVSDFALPGISCATRWATSRRCASALNFLGHAANEWEGMGTRTSLLVGVLQAEIATCQRVALRFEGAPFARYAGHPRGRDADQL